MNNENELKELVRQKYSEIAGQERSQNLSSCCGVTACCSDDVYNIMADEYTQLEGYNPDADLGLGCGIPTALQKSRKAIPCWTWAAVPVMMPLWRVKP